MFSNVKSIEKKANFYFDGNVSSRTIHLNTGERKTLGFMLKGEYLFNAGVEELMEVLNGEMKIKLQGETEYSNFVQGTSFIVPKNTSFNVIVDSFADYCCSYKD